jgi:hypothetical protein
MVNGAWGMGEAVRWGGSAVLGFHASSLKSAEPPTRLAPQVEHLPSASRRMLHLPSWGMGNGNGKELLPMPDAHCPITNYPLPITHYPLPITHYQLPNALIRCFTVAKLPIPDKHLTLPHPHRSLRQFGKRLTQGAA